MSDQNSQAQGLRQRLNAPGETQSAHYADFLQQREADIKGFRQLAALDEIEAEFENIRTAWNWAVQQKNYDTINRAIESLDWFCLMRGRHREAEALFQLAREQLAPGPGEEPHPVWGRIVARHPDPAEDREAQIERSLRTAQKRGDQEETAYCLRALGEVAFNAEDYAKALPFYEESLAHYRTLDDGFNVAATLDKLAQTYRLLGEPEKAIECARQSLNLSREIGDRFWAASSLVNTGIIAFYTGNYTEAEGYLREANTIYREMGYRVGIASSNVVLSRLAFLRRDFEKAKALAEQALQIATDIGSKRVAQSALDLDRLVARTLGEKKVERLDEEKPVPITDIPSTIDRFEVKGLIYAGGMGSYYLAHDPNSGREVVVKVANPEALKQFDWVLKGFRQEAELVKLSKHPAFPEIYDYSEAADQVYIVVEYIGGKTLVDILGEQEGFLPERDVIEWAIQICDALTCMHNQRPAPIIFRNVEPVNVIVDHHGRIRLVDFLVAEPYRAGREQSAVGKEGYGSPEQYFGYTDTRSDIYALGATLHHLLTRRDPREGMLFHYPPPRSLNPAISEELEAVIMKAVEHHPEDRYQSTEEMKAALLACLGREQ
jgi:tetratricopeptide (TPR) repeat protein